MTCSRCGGLVLYEIEETRCVNCGHRPIGEAEGMPRFTSEEHRQNWIEARHKKPGTPTSLSDHDEPETAETVAQPMATSEPSLPSCSIPGCKKMRYGNSVQCERHYKKSLRNNIKHRARAKQAMNGTADGATWKSPVLVALFEQRELAQSRLQEIDRLISAVRGV